MIQVEGGKKDEIRIKAIPPLTQQHLALRVSKHPVNIYKTFYSTL
jgi:hypothetical protein